MNHIAIGNLPQMQSLLGNLTAKTNNTANALSYRSILQSLAAPDETHSGAIDFEAEWKASFERHYGQSAGQCFYHVADASDISLGLWTHNDFPRDKFFRENFDESVLTWQPSRMNPSQLDTAVQRKINSTLGKNAIVVPPALDEKMKNDPALTKQVMANIDAVYDFHAPRADVFRVYSSVIILDEEGNVAQSCVSSGGGTLTGPSEEDLRHMAAKKKRRLERRLANEYIAERAAQKYFADRFFTMRQSAKQISAYL